MNIFFDTSSLVKRYLDEPGSENVEEIFSKANQVSVSIICLPEAISTLNRKKRENIISIEQYKVIKERLLLEFEDFLTVPLTPEVLAMSIQLIEKFPLRAMDALHLACALELKADLFVSSDQAQLGTAKKIKFKIYNV